VLAQPPTKSSGEFNKNAHTFILGKASWKEAFCKTKLYQRQLISEKQEAVLTWTKLAHGWMQ
jgi:hypothetical protein